MYITLSPLNDLSSDYGQSVWIIMFEEKEGANMKKGQAFSKAIRNSFFKIIRFLWEWIT